MSEKNKREEVPEGAGVFPHIPSDVPVDPLLLAVIHALVFLDGSSEEIVEPDAAEEAAEHIVAYLQRLEGPARERIEEEVRRLADYAAKQKWPKEQVLFLKEFLKNYGIGGQ